MNIKEALAHPRVEYARKNLWGSGTTTVPEQFGEALAKLSEDDRQLVHVLFAAATTSCPVPVSLIENQKYGPNYLEERYTSVSFWFCYLKEGVLKNTSFGESVDLTRLGGRGPAKDEGWIPVGRESCLVGPSTYEGHVLSRQIIDIINYSKKYELDVAEYTLCALDVIIITATPPSEPIRAVASLAIFMHELGFGREHLQDRLFDAGYRDETPEGYWRPIFKHLNIMLPEGLQFHD